jgi:hypothetical protein
MHTRNKFVTNSSSSCMIMWEKDPDKYPDPDDMKRYGGGIECPECGYCFRKPKEEELDDYMEDCHKEIVSRKISEGCAVFYNIEYLGHYAEDEVEHGDEDSGWYSFQC